MNLINVPYLRVSRSFPEEIEKLTLALDKTYIDIANAVNARTIGIFSVASSVITGESWYVNKNQRQQSIRQTYTFTNTNPISTGLGINQVDRFSRLFGTYTDAAGNWYGLNPGTNVAIAGQITFYISPVNGKFQINFLVGAGAPALVSGTLVIEWLSVP